MTLSLQELTNARETVRDLLDLLQLKAYLFEVESKDYHREIRIDCRIRDQWRSVVFEADYEHLIASKEAGQPRKELLSAWQKHLGACTRNGYEGD